MKSLLDTFTSDTDEGRQLRGGLLNMGIGLLSGSTGNYGQFAPALAQGFAGYQQGRQQVIDDSFKKQQIAQMQAMRNMQMQSMQRLQKEQEEAQSIISSGIDYQSAMRHANPHVRDWAMQMADTDYKNRALSARGTGSRSGLVPTTQGYAYLNENGKTQFLTGIDGKPLMPVSAAASDPNVQGAISERKAYGTEKGKDRAKNEASFAGELSNADVMISTINKALEHPGLSISTGKTSILPDLPGSNAANFKALHNQIKGQVFLAAFARLKGGGAITDTEGLKAENAMARLDLAQSEEAYREALKELLDIVDKGRQRLIERMNVTQPQNTQSTMSTHQQGRVVKTGVFNGRKVVQYDDGSVAYMD